MNLHGKDYCQDIYISMFKKYFLFCPSASDYQIEKGDILNK